MSEDLARFLADRYDEAVARARRSGGGKWHADDSGGEGPAIFEESDRGPLLIADHLNDLDAIYIAAVDPAHRLADIKLKRAILAEHAHEAASTPAYRKGPESFGCATCDYIADEGIYGGGWCATARQLGTEFTSHPAYKPGWAPEGETDGT